MKHLPSERARAAFAAPSFMICCSLFTNRLVNGYFLHLGADFLAGADCAGVMKPNLKLAVRLVEVG
jgi:hypothetical protein